VGPYFFDGTVTGESYLEMLREVVLPQLWNSPLYDNIKIIWQQDSAAPPHYSLRVREFLNNSFPEWIGRRGTADWPPKSCDLMPCDFSVWGIMKNKDFSQRPTDLEHLQTITETLFENMDGDKNLCTTTVICIVERCRRCNKQNGKHFEQFLKYNKR
jgi:hypothetical protein